MMQNDNRTVSSLLAVLIALALLVSCAPSSDMLSVSENRLYLPIIANETHAVIYGVENEAQDWQDYAAMYPGFLLKVSAHMARENPMPSVYNWLTLDRKTNGHTGRLFVSLRGSSSWVNGGQEVCKLPLPVFYLQYLAYVDALIWRYQPDYVEIWNEPDTDYTGAPMYFGCIGEDYQSGVEYAVFAEMVAGHIRARHPEVVILSGALMNVTGEFARGFLEHERGADGISFHYYAYCGTDYRQVDAMAAHLASSTENPVYLSETAMIYDVDTPECEQEQADYAAYLLTVDSIEMATWYNGTRNGWRNSDLVGADGAQKAAYYAFTSLTNITKK